MQKILKWGKLFILHFLKKFQIVMITSFTITLNYAVLTLPFSNYFYSFIKTFKNAGLKQVRGRFHGCGTLTSIEALDT